jgi:hypothetical protein
VIVVRNAHVQTILLDLELAFVSDGQDYGVFGVDRPDVIFHFIGSNQIFRAQLFICVIPADAKTLPTPEMPFCLAPQGTASIFSSMPRWGGFFLLLPKAVGLTANRTTATETRQLEIFIENLRKLNETG